MACFKIFSGQSVTEKERVRAVYFIVIHAYFNYITYTFIIIFNNYI